MAKSGSLLERIAGCPGLTPAEREVAHFYQGSYPGVALLNLREVCAAVGVSTATVTRFARRLGYNDFRDLSRSIQDEVRSQLDSPRERLNRLQESVRTGTVQSGPLTQRYTLAVTDLRDTVRGVDPAAFEHLTTLIADDRRPLILAAVASGQPLMAYFGLLLSYLRGGVTVLDGTDRWAHQLAGLSADAVVVAGAFDRYPLPVQRLLRFARTKGAGTALLTNRKSSPLISEADVTLLVSSQTDPVFRSRMGLVLVLEALLDAVAATHPDRTERADDIDRVFTLMGGYLSPKSPQTD